MYCSSCGKLMDAGARFCSNCGAAFSPASPYGSAFNATPVTGQLTRPRTPRAIAGVCSGIALYYGWDITLVRLVWILCVIFGGTGILAYIIAWVIIPEAEYVVPVTGFSTSPANPTGTSPGATI